MIIKKKYSTIKKIAENNPENGIMPEFTDEPYTEDIDFEREYENENLQEEETAEFTGQEEEKINDIQDLDLSLENIRFEQREERREGTRRRGYRRSQDRNIITRAQQEALSIRDIARKEGYNTGIKEAQKDLLEINEKLAQFFDCKNEVYEKVSGCILDIAVQIAKKIICREVDENREYIIPIIKGLVDEINKTENKIILKVTPKDVEIVADKVKEIFPSTFYEAKISVIPDNSIKDGGVIIETSNGIIDASIDTQLSIIEQALKKSEEES